MRARAAPPRGHHRLRGPGRPSPRSSWRPSPAPPGIMVPPPGYLAGRPRDLRPVRDRLHPRRGHGGLRPHRPVVRRRPLRRHPRPADLRQGRQLRLCAARRRRDLRRDRRRPSTSGPTPAASTYSGHPLACASAVATINAMAEEGIVENAAAHRRERHRPGAAGARRAPPVASARSAGSASSGRWTWSRTRRPASRWSRTTRPARPTRPWPTFAAACKRGGLWPFVNMNRTHVVPPCNVTEAEAKEGLAILDEALTRPTRTPRSRALTRRHVSHAAFDVSPSV